MPKGIYDRDMMLRCGINLYGPNAKGQTCARPLGPNGRCLSAHALAGMAAAQRRYRDRRRARTRSAEAEAA